MSHGQRRQRRLAALSVAVLTLTGCDLASRAEADHSSPPAVAPARGNAVDRVVAGPPVRKELTRRTVQPGRVGAFESTPLVARIPGYVASVAVDIGDVVRQGDSLLRIAAPELLDDVAQHEALTAQAASQVLQAEAAIAAARAAVQTAAASREQALAGVEAAEAIVARWRSERDRVVQLASGGSVTQKLADEAESQLLAATAAVRQAQAAVVVAEAGAAQADASVVQAEADLAAAKARVGVAQANLARAKTMLAFTEIRAPFDGVVTSRAVDTGHFVQPAASGAARPLLEVARTDKVRVSVDIPELDAPLVNPGDGAGVRVQALGDRDFAGEVVRTAWALDAGNRSLRAEIDLDNPDGVLRPGMYVMATIVLDTRPDALTLPATAVLRRGNEYVCCCVVEDTVRLRPIQLGLRTDADIEIVAGVSEADLVVQVRADSLVDGQVVELASDK